MNLKEEKIGELYLLGELLLYSLFPLIINLTSKSMPPILFAALSSAIAGIIFSTHLVLKKQLKEVFNKKAFLYSLGVTIFIVIIPSSFIFTGTKLTTSVNTAIFLQTEVLFALLICSIFFKEKLTIYRILGSFLILAGAITVLYNGSFQINKGDILIIIGTFFYPIGNVFAKKALKLVKPVTILAIRSILGSIALLIISLAWEKSGNSIFNISTANLYFLLANGIIVTTISKILWYEGLKRLDINKATSIAMSYPAISLILSAIFLHEIPSLYQITGLIIIMTGVYFTIKKTASSKIAELDFPA